MMKILFHPNSPWQLNGLDRLSNYGSCIQVILTWPPYFQFASYGPELHSMFLVL